MSTYTITLSAELDIALEFERRRINKERQPLQTTS
jgi:hypothetical protein